MVTLDSTELCNVVGGTGGIGPIPGTTIYRLPPKEEVCNQDQFDWMAARVGKGVERHVVLADAALCGFTLPGATATAPTVAAPSTSAQGILDSIKFDELNALAGR
jgi:hypothetical protein